MNHFSHLTHLIIPLPWLHLTRLYLCPARPRPQKPQVSSAATHMTRKTRLALARPSRRDQCSRWSREGSTPIWLRGTDTSRIMIHSTNTGPSIQITLVIHITWDTCSHMAVSAGVRLTQRGMKKTPMRTGPSWRRDPRGTLADLEQLMGVIRPSPLPATLRATPKSTRQKRLLHAPTLAARRSSPAPTT